MLAREAMAARSARVVPQVGTAANRHRGHAIRQLEKNRDALHRAGIYHGDEFVFEAAEFRIGRRVIE